MSAPDYDCVIVGGGIIGLSIAVELSEHGRQVHVLDDRPPPAIASWAAAGILPPPIRRALHDPLEQLRDLSHPLYADWCRRLSASSGMEVSYEQCGGIYLGRTMGERVALRAALDQWHSDGLRVLQWSVAELRREEPHLDLMCEESSVYFLPDEVLVRPPRLLKALRETLRRARVSIDDTRPVIGWSSFAADHVGLLTSTGPLTARHVCVAAGPWTARLLAPLGLDIPVEPRRGQMVAWQLPQPLVRRVINEGPRYLVPRRDGYLLAGSTVEDVGFCNEVTPAGEHELVQFARSLLPRLRDVSPCLRWAGLRPASLSGRPYLGRVPGHPQLTVATGHFRSGIHLAPITARLMRQLICDQTPDLDLAPFSLSH